MPKPSDIEVAQFLADFRERAKPEQEVSPVMEELRAFPQWADGAVYRPPVAPPPPKSEPLPDPRLPAHERAAAMPKVAVKPGPGDSRSIVSADSVKKQNPWAEASPPPATGLVFMNIDSEVPPPYPGSWERRPGGWLRKE